MATATQPLALWVDGFSVVYDTGTNVIQAVTYTNAALGPVKVAVMHAGAIVGELLVPPGQPLQVGVSHLGVPMSAIAQGLPPGWGVRILPG